MKISVKVKPNSKVESVECLGNNEFTVRVKAPAKEGRANARLIELLSDYFHVAKSAFSVVRGQKSRIKLIEIKDIS